MLFLYKRNDFISIQRFSAFFQRLECYLLMLLRCINMKRSNELSNLIQDISNIVKCLKNISKHAKVIQPRLYLLLAYLYVLRGRKSSTRIYLYKAQKSATLQGNQLMLAWIIQNRRVINLTKNNQLYQLINKINETLIFN